MSFKSRDCFFLFFENRFCFFENRFILLIESVQMKQQVSNSFQIVKLIIQLRVFRNFDNFDNYWKYEISEKYCPKMIDRFKGQYLISQCCENVLIRFEIRFIKFL